MLQLVQSRLLFVKSNNCTTAFILIVGPAESSNLCSICFLAPIRSLIEREDIGKLQVSIVVLRASFEFVF